MYDCNLELINNEGLLHKGPAVVCEVITALHTKINTELKL